MSSFKVSNVVQGSDQWHEERWGAVGGTRLQSAVGAKFSKAKGKGVWTLGDKKIQRTLMLEIVSELQSIQEIDEYCSPAMERGNELEPFSVKEASTRLNKELVKCGMLVSDEMPRFKYSPDAVFYSEGEIVGGYETKSKAGKYHIECLLNDEVPNEHLWQCLAPMVMSDSVKWWAFGHYDDRNMVGKLFLTGVKRADYESLIMQARELLKEFFNDLEEMLIRVGGAYNG